MRKVTEDQENRGQWFWVFIIRIIALLMFIIPLYKPMYSYLKFDIDIIRLTFHDVVFILSGLVIVMSGKKLGIITNNIGAILTNFLKKVTS